jgi:hypothetical protein
MLLSGLSLISCNKDEVHRREAEAISSFEGDWAFVDARFAYGKDGLLYISFDHEKDDSNVAYEISFKNIESIEASTTLIYTESPSNLPTSNLFVTEGGDVLGDSYAIDSTAAVESILTIDCISNNKITGKFQVNFIREAGGESPYGLPEKFSLTEGKFDARQ